MSTHLGLLESRNLLPLLHLPARPDSKVIGDASSVRYLDLTLVQRSQRCNAVDGGEEVLDRGGGEEYESAACGVQEEGEGASKLLVGYLFDGVCAVSKSTESCRRPGRRTSFRKGGSATAISIVPRSSSGTSSGSSMSYGT